MQVNRVSKNVQKKGTQGIKITARNIAFVLSLFDTGVGVIRSLGRAGIPVIGLDSDPIMPGFRSRYCKALLSPDPIGEPEALLDFLVEQGKQLDEPGVLMPASDAYVLFIAEHQHVLHKYFLFTLPPDSVLEAMVNKRCQYELAEKMEMPIAKTVYPATMADVERIQDDLEYPVFIKPYMGHLWREKFGSSHKGFKVYSAQELANRFAEIFPTGLKAMVQTIILGPNTNHYKVNAYISRTGNVLASFTLRKIHQYPTEFGVGTCVESIYYPELLELGLKFLRDIHYCGVASIEFKRDERDGQLKMIELNPRFWQQNILATDCGVNFPLIEYLDLVGVDQTPVTEFRTGVKWLDIVIDFPAFWDFYRRKETTPLQWLKSWKGVRSYPVLARDDLGPFFKKYEYGKKLMGLPRLLLRSRDKSERVDHGRKFS